MRAVSVFTRVRCSRLEVSYNHIPNANWCDLPLKGVLKRIIREDMRDVLEGGEVMQSSRQTAHIVWGELKFLDDNDNRDAYSRMCVGIGSGIQCLITFDYWADDTELMTPVWDVVLESLTLDFIFVTRLQGWAFQSKS